MGSVEQTKAGLATAKAEAERLLALLAKLVGQVDRAVAMLQATTTGSGQPRAADALAKLVQARRGFSEGAAAIRSAVGVADEYGRRL